MSDLQTECCMCGDVGFQDKLFSCTTKGCNRFQHSYCSSNYSENAEPIEVCAWCEDQGKKSPSPSWSRHGNNNNNKSRSGHANEKIKRDEGGSSAEKATGKAPSPRTRRYKLLKDV